MNPHMDTMPALDPLTLPLHGSHLIEASAGTGKTFTIALLYVRLVLGPAHPADDTSFARPLTPPEILVVTFTNAATHELRERIRTRLVEAAMVFREAEGRDADALLVALRAQYAPGHWSACARRLALAAEGMDEAAVSTIHSWCFRMLREHAFDSGSLFSLTLEHDTRELLQDVVRDYWRMFYYSLDHEALATLSRYWTSPASLYQKVKQLLAESEALGALRPAPHVTLAAAEKARDAELHVLKAPWPAWLDELGPALEAAAARQAFQGASFNAAMRANWLGALRTWSTGEADAPVLTDTAWKRMTPDGMHAIWTTGEPPCPHVWQALAELPTALAQLPDPYDDLLIHATQWCRARLEREQARLTQVSPDGLLTHLDRALQGPSGEALAATMRGQFPLALIDEFQDTDPVQYRIFKAIYRPAEPHHDAGLLLIGDPKQAIYAFRGADIYTYLQARRDTRGRHVTLGTNFRSSDAMVDAVNRVFNGAEAGAEGAFLFKQHAEPLPFQPVEVNDREDRWVVDGQALPAMTFWVLEAQKAVTKTAYIDTLADCCASEMVTLLSAGQQERAGFQTGKTLDPLKAADMAVLVNNGTEAQAIRHALAIRGVKSVYLSEKDKVFASPMATQVLQWLRACAEPLASSREAENALRVALATPALGLTLADLDMLGRDERIWEAYLEQFSAYHRRWQRQGVQALLRRLMADFAVPKRLLAYDNTGERQLTDLLHLGELLQHASQSLDGEHALIRFLEDAIADPDSQDNSHQLRLESDADLVKVVTIHKAKGLQYPLVFLPFIATHRSTKASDLPLRWHDEEGRLQLSVSADEATVARADRERLAEDLRKLYVALTRACHATWIGIAPLKGIANSALGHVIHGGEPRSSETAPEAGGLMHALQPLAKEGVIAVQTAPPPSASRYQAQGRQARLGAARKPTRPAREHWWIASYSALPLSGTLTAPVPLPVSEPETSAEDATLDVLDEVAAAGATLPDSKTGSAIPTLHHFPRGPIPGIFLHGVLEWTGQQGFGAVARDRAASDDMLRRRLQGRRWQSWHTLLSDWLADLLTRPLPLPEGGSMALSTLLHYQVELEFWFAAHHVDTSALDRLVSTHLLPGMDRPALERETLNGMMKGFIDLVFEHDGRFYVLDWKSNYLGQGDSAYSADAMQEAVLKKRYDLQAALYLLAMHRLLKARLPDYHPEQHLGGALTVFLRGSASPERGVHAVSSPVALIHALDHLFSRDERHRVDTTQEPI